VGWSEYKIDNDNIIKLDDENPNYWNAETLIQEYKDRKFVNVATTFGRTHIKDELGQNLNLNGCDIDCEEAYKRILCLILKI